MNMKPRDLMGAHVTTGQPYLTGDRLRRLLDSTQVSARPVVESEGAGVGVVSSADLVPALKDGASTG